MTGGVEIPEGCDPESFVEGYKAAMRHVADAAEVFAAEPGEEPDGGPDRCDECGGPMVEQLGGLVCPSCG